MREEGVGVTYVDNLTCDDEGERGMLTDVIVGGFIGVIKRETRDGTKNERWRRDADCEDGGFTKEESQQR